LLGPCFYSIQTSHGKYNALLLVSHVNLIFTYKRCKPGLLWPGCFDIIMTNDAEETPAFANQLCAIITERASKVRRTALLPSISAQRYDDAWTKFLLWKDNQTDSGSIPNEEMLLVYFDDISEQFAASSLWTIYSMLKRQMLVSVFFYHYRSITIWTLSHLLTAI
jgi:hypothetical protein